MGTPLKADLERPDKLKEPVLRGDTITADRYTCREYMQREWQRVWRRVWNIGGMAYQAPEPGDFLVTELGAESIIMVRQEGGAFRAFYNSCVHRGTRLTEAADGHVAHFNCPYHGWEYDRTGLVVSVPNANDYPQGNPCGKLRLNEVKCAELWGMVWFNMDPQAGSVEEFFGPTVVADIGSHRMETMVRVLNITARAECNWKIITDNFNEAYHVQVLHPELVPYITTDYVDSQFDMMSGGHNRGWFPSFIPSAGYKSDRVGEPLISMVKQWGIDSNEYVGRERWKQLRLDVQAKKRELGPSRGYRHYAWLADYQLTDYIIYNLFPNSVITVGPDGVQLLRPRPHPTDPAKCLFDHWWMVNRIEGQSMTPSPAGGPDLPVEDAEHEVIDYGDKTLGTTADQDLSIAAIQQRGLASGGYRGSYLAGQERRVQAFHDVLNDYMART
jgi:phenylpropionate dioxygenase-like ring-hydroxylating dioxygenase large terminal subunit